VFDISCANTFNQTEVWIDSIRDSSNDSSPIDVILVGNKCDLERAVSREEAEALAKKFQIPYFETSAKQATNVDAAFQSLAEAALKRRVQTGGKFARTAKTQVVVDPGNRNRDEDGKCC
jgi:GTPase SAR1 family protein